MDVLSFRPSNITRSLATLFVIAPMATFEIEYNYSLGFLLFSYSSLYCMCICALEHITKVNIYYIP